MPIQQNSLCIKVSICNTVVIHKLDPFCHINCNPHNILILQLLVLQHQVMNRSTFHELGHHTQPMIIIHANTAELQNVPMTTSHEFQQILVELKLVRIPFITPLQLLNPNPLPHINSLVRSWPNLLNKLHAI
ncbi:hypothetical protein V8G54_036349 [Vigna mungo]|uniref:Uncharacterized protein n=1 Tax=Vigna mungo TaxID=3915 RepID=A0AAQ3RGH6_VIGMU